MPVVHRNEIELYYEITGEGEPLVYIPGWGTEITTCSEQIAIFAEKFRVIAIDNRGTGRSGKPDEPYSIDQMADDIIGVLDALEIPRAHVIGISLGSMIAQSLSARYPSRVNRLVLHLGFTRISFRVKVLMTLLRFLPGSREKGASAIFGQAHPPTPASMRRQGEAGARFDGRKILAEIRVPTLIVNASRDPLVPAAITRELAHGIRGAELVLIDGDHTISRTRPEVLFQYAEGFLSGACP